MFLILGDISVGSVRRVVVTGAAGFVGWHIARFLESKGLEVVRSDIVRPYVTQDGWRKADLLSLRELVEATRGADAICHIGGIGDVYAANRQPWLAMNVNVTGTANVIEACKRNQIPELVFASTWEVYGTPKYEPVDENHPCTPGHPYAVSKLAGDLLVQSANSPEDLRTTALRLGTAYGPRMRETAVIASFVQKALSRRQITIQGTGTQFRQFTNVRDIAAAFYLALVATRRATVYNIVAGQSTTITELAEMIGRLIPVQIVFVDARKQDPPSARISSLRAERELGWRPQITIKQGLEDFVNQAAASLPQRIPSYRAA